MITTAPKHVVGWCPGALRPMQSGDGLLVRVRTHAGALTSRQLLSLCDAAQRFGNGIIDLTRRANLQLRGVRPDTLPPLQSLLGALDLLDRCVEAEAVRNFSISPLAGLDPAEHFDGRIVARELETIFATNERLWRLPQKFAVLVDGGGELSLHDVSADVRLRAVPGPTGTCVAIGLERSDRIIWIGQTTVDRVAAAVALVAQAYLSAAPAGGTQRMRSLPTLAIEKIRTSASDFLAPLNHSIDTGVAVNRTRLRDVAIKDGGTAFAVAVPFGSVEADALLRLTTAALSMGCEEIRLSPWRTLYFPIGNDASAEDLARRALELGFIRDAADPVLQIDACPGSPACRSAALNTRSVARALAPLLSRLGDIRSIHVSGCAKGCARSLPADLVLTGGPGRVAVIRNGRPDGEAEFHVGTDEFKSVHTAFRLIKGGT